MTIGGTAVIVPVRDAASAKSRLGAQLDPGARRSLVIAMLDDLLASVRRVHDGPLLIVSPDSAYAGVATTHGATVVPDPGAGLNAALEAAIGMAASPPFAVEAVLLLPGDLPHVAAADLEVVLEALAEPGAVLVASGDGGTIAFGMRPPGLLAPQFGEDSAARHRASAAAARVDLRELELTTMRIDIDTLADLDRVGELLGEATTALLERLPIGAPVDAGRDPTAASEDAP